MRPATNPGPFPADRVRTGRGRKAKAQSTSRKASLQRLALESLEPRTLLATLPAPTVSLLSNISGSVGNESTPSIVINKHDPSKMVAVWTRSDPTLSGVTKVVAEGAYSTDGGTTWNSLSLPGVYTDPTSDSKNPVDFTRVTDISAGFDRNDQFYILDMQSSDKAGVLTLNKYDFSNSTPLRIVSNRVLQSWTQNPIVLPTLAVDDNLTTPYIDPTSPTATQFDPHSGAVYVAWASNDSNPDSVNNFNPNDIRLIASFDGGTSFSTPVNISSNGGENRGTDRNTMPKLAISQGSTNGDVPGGQVSIVWDDFGSGASRSTPQDDIKFARILDGFSKAYAGAGGAINDYDATNKVSVTTTFPISTTGLSSLFSSVNDLDVQLALTDPSLADISINLVAPDGKTTVNLVPNGTLTGTNMGFGTGGVHFGTVFDDQSPLSEGKAAAPYIVRLRPGGSLATFTALGPGRWTGRGRSRSPITGGTASLPARCTTRR